MKNTPDPPQPDKNTHKTMNNNAITTMPPDGAANNAALFASPTANQAAGLAAVTSNAATTQTLASIWIAKQFPRNLAQVTNDMQQACARKSLAEQAMYSYPRGGTAVTGVSIRLADALLLAWGNAESGWKEISRRYDAKKACTVSECIAFAVDKQANIRAEIAFSVPHVRNTRKGDILLTDERDIYELCANMSARRRRACILQILPAWLIEEATEAVNATLERGDSKKTLPDLLRSMEAKFKALGIDRKQLEDNLGHKLEETTRAELRSLGQSYNAIADGHVRASDIFGTAKPDPESAKVGQPTAPAATATTTEPVKPENADEIPGLGASTSIPSFGQAYFD